MRTRNPAPRVLCLLLFVLSVAPAAADETIRFGRLSLEDGLSQSSVNCMAQDRQGRLWFGTQDGLNRYDGYEFTVFKPDPDDPGSLSHRFIWSIHVDRHARVWVGTEGGGLELWNPIDDSFTHFRHDPEDANSLVSDKVHTITEGPDGALWIGAVGGLSRFDYSTGSFTNFKHDPENPASLGSDKVRAMHVDPDGRLWIGLDGAGLDRLDPGASTFVHYLSDPGDANTLGDNSIRAIHQGADGRLWIGTYDAGLNRFDTRTGEFERLASEIATLGEDRVRALLVDKSGTLWIGSDHGLRRRDPDGAFLAYHHEPADPHSLSNDRILSIFQDRSGLLWVATQAGLNRWNPTLGSFSHFKQDSSARTSLSNNVVTSFATRPGSPELWIGTFGGGLNALDRSTGQYRHYRHDPEVPGSISDDRVMSALLDSQGDLWIGTMTGGLNRLPHGADQFQRFVHDADDPLSLSANGVTSLHEGASGRLWVGTYGGGVSLFDRPSESFSRYRHDPKREETLGSDRVMAVFEDSDGSAWIGTAGGGLTRIERDRGIVTRYVHDPADPSSLSNDNILAIRESSDGTLWVGTQGGGLNRLRPQDRADGQVRFERYTEKQGLPNALVYGILEDATGSVWLSTNKGLSRLDPSNDTFINYDVTHGLQSNEFNHGAYHRSQDGELFVGGNNGFNTFFPQSIRRNDHVPPVLLTGIFKSNERADFDLPLWELDELTLNYWDDVVSFEFAALDFAAPHKNLYAYTLDGFDNGWIDLGHMRRATYTNLNPGSYLLRVRGSNNDGQWNEQGVSLAITVLPPPWRTWWAYSLYVVAGVGMLLGYANLQARKLRREEEHSRTLERTVAERTAELAKRNHDLAEVNIKLENASLTDPHTGLRNRRFMMEHLRKDIALVDRDYRNRPELVQRAARDFLFLTIDLDGFKPINDTYGHDAGDRVLLRVRDCLVSVCRTSDTLIRLGGDEFLVVARDTNRESAVVLADRIRQAICDIRLDSDKAGLADIRVGCSIGFAFYPFNTVQPTATRWERVLAVADRALYMAKESGRNAWFGVLEGTEPFGPEDVEGVLSDPERMAREGKISIVSSRSRQEAASTVPVSS